MILKKEITMKPKTFYNLLAEQNLSLSDQQKKQFERYFELLVEWNEKINLTAITDKEEVLPKAPWFFVHLIRLLHLYPCQSP